MLGQFHLMGGVNQITKDGVDVGIDQDTTVLTGFTATLTSNYPKGVPCPDGDDVDYIDQRTIVLMSDGSISEDGVTAGISLTAHDPDLFSTALQWTIQPGVVTLTSGKTMRPKKWTFNAPLAGETATLGGLTPVAGMELLPAPGSTVWDLITGVPTFVQGLADAADAAAARAAIGADAKGTAFSTADYAAVSGDDRPRVLAAVTAAVAAITATGQDQTVLIHAPLTFTTGTVKAAIGGGTIDPSDQAYGNQGVPIPVNLAHTLHIVFSPGAKITLSSACKTAFYINKLADYDVFQNVNFYDAWVDGANVPSTSHALIGNYLNYSTYVRYLSYQNINFFGKTLFTNMFYDPDGSSGEGHTGIAFLGEHNGPLEPTQTFTKNIYLENGEQYGGGGLLACNSTLANRHRPGGVNHYYNNIVVGRYKYINPSVTTAYVNTTQTGIFITGSGFGDYAYIGPGYVENIGDDAIEVGTMQTLVIDRPRSKDAYYLGIMLRQAHAPINVESQKILIRGLTCEVTTAITSQTGAWGYPIRMMSNDQVIVITGTASGGTGSIVIPGVGTAAGISATASAAAIQTAVRAIDPSLNTSVATGGPLGTAPVTLRVGRVSLTTPITLTIGSLTGGSWTHILSPTLNASFGTVTIEDPVWKVDGLTFSKQNRASGLFVNGLDQPHRKVEIIRPKVIWNNYSHDASSTDDLSLYYHAAPYPGWGHLILQDHDLTLTGSCDFSAGSGQGTLMELLASGVGRVEIDGMTNDRAASVNGQLYMVVAGRNTGAGVRVQMNRIKPKTIATSQTNSGVRLYNTGTVNQFDLFDSDFSLGTASDTNAINLGNAGTNAANFHASRIILPETGFHAVDGQAVGSSGTSTAVTVAPTINQSGTANYVGLLVDVTETATGSGTKTPLRIRTGGTDRLTLSNTGQLYIAGGLELGDLADTTLTRSAAGKLAVEGMDVVLISGTQTLAGKTLTSPKIATVLDTSSHNILTLTPSSASAVNYVGIENADTGNAPSLTANGSDANVGFIIAPKGSSSVTVFMGTGQPTATVAAKGIATDVTLNLTSKGAGTVQSNGNDVATASIQTLAIAANLVAIKNHRLTVLLATGGLPTLLTAVGNTTIYTVKNTTGSPINLATTSSQTIDGSAGPLAIASLAKVTVVSDNANWWII